MSEMSRNSEFESKPKRPRGLIITGTKSTFQDPIHPQTLIKGLNDQRSRGEFCDLVLEVDSKSFPVHKNVLSIASSYFQAMFQGTPSDLVQHRYPLSGVDAEAVSLILEYIYTSSIIITIDNAQSLLSASDLLQIPVLHDACYHFLEKQTVDDENFCKLLQFADHYGDLKLAQKAKSHVVKNFSSAVHSKEFLDLPADVLIEILSSDDLEIKQEEQVFKAAKLWLNHSYAIREDVFPEVLKSVRMSFLSLEYLLEVVKVDNAVAFSPEALKAVEEARLYHQNPDPTKYLTSSVAFPRKNADRIAKDNVVSQLLSKVEETDIGTGVWTELQEDNSSVRYALLSIYEGRLLLHVLQETPPPAEAIILPYGRVRGLCTNATPAAFLELSWEGSSGNIVIVKLENNVRGKQFTVLCTGIEAGASYAESHLLKVWRKGTEGESVYGGDYDGKGGAQTVPGAAWEGDYRRPAASGVVFCPYYGRKTEAGQFSIVTRDWPFETVNNYFGRIQAGLETVREAAKLEDIKSIVVTSCGIVLA